MQISETRRVDRNLLRKIRETRVTSGSVDQGCYVTLTFVIARSISGAEGRTSSEARERGMSAEAHESDSLDDLFRLVQRWAMDELGPVEPEIPARKLVEEVEELLEDPTDGEELADCAMMVARLADVADIDLVAEIRRKLAINRERVWEQSEDGTFNHVASAGGSGEGGSVGSESSRSG